MESMSLTENDENSSSTAGEANVDKNVGKKKPDAKLRRSSRVIPKPTPNKTEQTSITIPENEEDIKKYYLCKKVKKHPPSLETIFEEPKDQHNVKLLMSNRRYRRFCDFSDVHKTKKRLMKVKKHSVGKNLKKQKVNLNVLKKKLQEIDEES